MAGLGPIMESGALCMEIILGVLVIVMVVVLRKELLGLKVIMTTGQDDAVLAEPHQFIERFHGPVTDFLGMVLANQ
jgi:hypothetical protein